jgi:hypothetical protein
MTNIFQTLGRFMPIAALYFLSALPGWSQSCVQPLKLETVALPYQLTSVEGTFTVQDPNHCGWTIQGKPSWISSIGPTSGRGPTTVNFTVAPSLQSGARAGAISIGNQYETVFQHAHDSPLCHDRSVTATQIIAEPGGGTYSFEVGGESSCSWRVDNSSPWIRFRLDASASNGDILFGARVDLTLSPQPFGAGPRVGVILADNQPVTVYQKGTPVCTYLHGEPIGPLCRHWVLPVSRVHQRCHESSKLQLDRLETLGCVWRQFQCCQDGKWSDLVRCGQLQQRPNRVGRSFHGGQLEL